MKGNLTGNHRHAPGFRSLVAEVITIAVLDFQRKRIREETKTAMRDGREYANTLASKEQKALFQFIFHGPMDAMIDLAYLNINADCIKDKLKND